MRAATPVGPADAETVSSDAFAALLFSSQNQSLAGSPVTFTATLVAAQPGSGILTGVVTFSDGASAFDNAPLDGTGAASVLTAALAGGLHQVTAHHGGDTNFNGGSSAGLVQSVVAPSSTSLASSPNPSSFGQAVTFTATVAGAAGGATPLGSVSFSDRNTVLGLSPLGQAILSVQLSSANHLITAAYAGDAHFSASTSAALGQAVNHDGAAVTLTSAANPSIFGSSIVPNVAVAGAQAIAPSGSVALQDGATPLASVTLDGTTLATVALDGSGSASFKASSCGAGTHPVTARYQGSGNYGASTSAAAERAPRVAGTRRKLPMPEREALSDGRRATDPSRSDLLSRLLRQLPPRARRRRRRGPASCRGQTRTGRGQGRSGPWRRKRRAQDKGGSRRVAVAPRKPPRGAVATRDSAPDRPAARRGTGCPCRRSLRTARWSVCRPSGHRRNGRAACSA